MNLLSFCMPCVFTLIPIFQLTPEFLTALDSYDRSHFVWLKRLPLLQKWIFITINSKALLQLCSIRLGKLSFHFHPPQSSFRFASSWWVGWFLLIHSVMARNPTRMLSSVIVTDDGFAASCEIQPECSSCESKKNKSYWWMQSSIQGCRLQMMGRAIPVFSVLCFMGTDACNY